MEEAACKARQMVGNLRRLQAVMTMVPPSRVVAPGEVKVDGEREKQ